MQLLQLTIRLASLPRGAAAPASARLFFSVQAWANRGEITETWCSEDTVEQRHDNGVHVNTDKIL